MKKSYTTQEAAEKLGVSRRRVQRMIQDGVLAAEHNGKAFLIPDKSIKNRLQHPDLRVGNTHEERKSQARSDIRNYMRRHPNTKNQSEIARATGWSVSTVNAHYNFLKDELNQK